MTRIWRYLDRLPVGPHGGGIIIAGVILAVILLVAWVTS
jgi:hypothetical protein